MYNLALEDRVRQQVQAISDGQLGTIFALSKLAEYRDTDTGGHLERVREYCRILARHLARQGRFAPVVDESFVTTIAAASALHDIGKVAVSDSILRKPAKLTAEEFEVIKGHCRLGAQTLWEVYLAHPANDFVHMAIEIAESHHERWDGRGYPYGLAGEAIPLSARILALADVYDAVRAKRCYKEAVPHAEAYRAIVGERGGHFAEVVDAFIAGADEFDAVSRAFAGSS